MKTLAMIAAAYIATGCHYVWRDYREPAWNQPSYIHAGLGSLLFMVFYWLPGTVVSTYVRGPIKRHVMSWIIFGGVLLGLVIGSRA